MNTENILKIIMSLDKPHSPTEYSISNIGNDNTTYFGKDFDDNVVFVIRSKSTKSFPNTRNTKKLSLFLDTVCTINENNISYEMISNILLCKSRDPLEINSFIRLCHSFAVGDCSNKSIVDFFSALVNLFSLTNKMEYDSLRGLFAELFTITYFYEQKINIAQYWQRKDKMKFDFMVDSNKRIDVKSTLNPIRIHHFIHEQLQTEDYDIIIISILLRESNEGISLFDVVKQCREIYSFDNYHLSLIEKKLYHYSDDELKKICFDKPYLYNNIRFVDAKDISKFKERTPDGVMDAEYSSNLTSCASLSLDGLKIWLDDAK